MWNKHLPRFDDVQGLIPATVEEEEDGKKKPKKGTEENPNKLSGCNDVLAAAKLWHRQPLSLPLPVTAAQALATAPSRIRAPST